jgi:hypothetical protein
MIYYSFPGSILFVFSHSRLKEVKASHSKKDEGLSVILNGLIEAGGSGNGCRYPDEGLKRHSFAEGTVNGAKSYHASESSCRRKESAILLL